MMGNKKHIAIIISIMLLMATITILHFSTKDDAPRYDGNFNVNGKGIGGASFDLVNPAKLNYQASGSLFNIYVGNVSQLAGYGSGKPFSYISELSTLNATSTEVSGELQPGSYVIIIEPLDGSSSNVSFSYKVSYHSSIIGDEWFAVLMAITLISLCAVVVYAYRQTRIRK